MSETYPWAAPLARKILASADPFDVAQAAVALKGARLQLWCEPDDDLLRLMGVPLDPPRRFHAWGGDCKGAGNDDAEALRAWARAVLT